MNEMLANALEKTIDNIYVGEYSPEQKCYNISTLKEMLETNREIFKSNSFNGYIPLCMGSMEEVRKYLDKLEEQYGRP